jgi:hypothetical protein
MINTRVFLFSGGNASLTTSCKAGIMKKLLIILVFLFSTPSMAEAPPVLEPLPDEATLPPPTGMDDEDLMEPEVTITKRDDAVVHEYRMNGQLYMVKVIPVKGYPYYLMDSDGDGSLESRYNQIDPALMVPRWMIFRW